MKNVSIVKYKIALFFLCFFVGVASSQASKPLRIGWANIDITPSKPVLLRGQIYARLSESVLDPLNATALVLESTSTDNKTTRVIMVTCDLVSIPDFVRDRARKLAKALVPELEPTDITISATHTHTAPLMTDTESDIAYGMPFTWITGGKIAMTPKEYTDFVSEQIAQVIAKAWKSRASGGISFGLGKAVLGHNRLHVNKDDKAKMYGKTDVPEFSHVEGYEDHNLNLLYTWNTSGKLTGVVINAAVTAQVSGHLFEISADFWTEARPLLREELGNKDLFILPQVSAAGDQSPWTTWDEKEEVRMQKLMGLEKYGTGRRSIGRRMQIARHIADGVKAILPYMKENIEWNPVIAQQTEAISLTMRPYKITDKVIENHRKNTASYKAKFDNMLADFAVHPEKRTGRWYKDVSNTFYIYDWYKRTDDQYIASGTKGRKYPIEVKVIRIGDMAFATNPFELYIDYGIQLKGRSPATQTFIVQLTGSGTYVPTQRSINGGAYGASLFSTPVGVEGAQELIDKTLEMLNSLWGK